MHIEARVIPVDGISRVPGFDEVLDHENADGQQTGELLLLKAATALALLLVSCAWIAIALD